MCYSLASPQQVPDAAVEALFPGSLAPWLPGRFSQRDALMEDWRMEMGEARISPLLSLLQTISSPL